MAFKKKSWGYVTGEYEILQNRKRKIQGQPKEFIELIEGAKKDARKYLQSKRRSA